MGQRQRRPGFAHEIDSIPGPLIGQGFVAGGHHRQRDRVAHVGADVGGGRGDDGRRHRHFENGVDHVQNAIRGQSVGQDHGCVVDSQRSFRGRHCNCRPLESHVVTRFQTQCGPGPRQCVVCQQRQQLIRIAQQVGQRALGHGRERGVVGREDRERFRFFQCLHQTRSLDGSLEHAQVRHRFEDLPQTRDRHGDHRIAAGDRAARVRDPHGVGAGIDHLHIGFLERRGRCPFDLRAVPGPLILDRSAPRRLDRQREGVAHEEVHRRHGLGHDLRCCRQQDRVNPVHHAIVGQQVRQDHLGVVHSHHVRHRHRHTGAIKRFIVARRQIGRRLASFEGMISQSTKQEFRVGQQVLPDSFGQRRECGVVGREDRERFRSFQCFHQTRSLDGGLEHAQVRHRFEDLPQTRDRHRHHRIPAGDRAARVGHVHRVGARVGYLSVRLEEHGRRLSLQILSVARPLIVDRPQSSRLDGQGNGVAHKRIHRAGGLSQDQRRFGQQEHGIEDVDHAVTCRQVRLDDLRLIDHQNSWFRLGHDDVGPLDRLVESRNQMCGCPCSRDRMIAQHREKEVLIGEDAIPQSCGQCREGRVARSQERERCRALECPVPPGRLHGSPEGAQFSGPFEQIPEIRDSDADCGVGTGNRPAGVG